MKKVSLFILELILIFSSVSVFSQSKTIAASELEVLKRIILSDSVPNIYYKTIIEDLNQPLSRQLFYLSDFDICSGLVQQDSMTLKRDERNFLAQRFSDMETKNINKLIREPKNHSLKELEGHNWLQISLPVVFRDGTCAIYYSKGVYSGQFVLMKNIEGVWMEVCYFSVWSQ